MGTPAQHHEKAEHHLAFLATIPDEYPDWLTTVAFYAAVEIVEMLCAERGIHSTSHESRKCYVRENFPRIHKPYHALYNASLDARYEAREHCLPAKEVRESLINGSLKQIQSFAKSRGRTA